MNHSSQTLLLGSFLWLLGGCVVTANPTPDNPFEGVYKVTSHTRNEMDCATPGAEVTDGDAFFKLSEETLFGQKILAYRACTSAASCAADPSLFESFIDEGKGWMRQIKTSGGSGTSCTLGLVEGPLVETDKGFTLDTKTTKLDLMLGANEMCDTDLVDAHRAEMMCTGVESLVAERQ